MEPGQNLVKYHAAINKRSSKSIVIHLPIDDVSTVAVVDGGVEVGVVVSKRGAVDKKPSVACRY